MENDVTKTAIDLSKTIDDLTKKTRVLAEMTMVLAKRITGLNYKTRNFAELCR